jgi:putative ABC transport system permease protein
LFGLATYSVTQRTKEIGIRKVLGASVASILLLLSKDYFRLILIAFLVAIPVANYFITEWLNNFTYRISIQWWLFALPGVMVLLIALFSVSAQTWKAAQRNPVDSLRYE